MLIIYSCLKHDLTPFIIPKDEKAKYISFLREGDIKEFVSFAVTLQEAEKERMQKFLQNTKINSQFVM